MKRPISTRMQYLQRLITQVLADMNWLLANLSEAEAKPYLELLAEINRDYHKRLDQLGEQLEALGGPEINLGKGGGSFDGIEPLYP